MYALDTAAESWKSSLHVLPCLSVVLLPRFRSLQDVKPREWGERETHSTTRQPKKDTKLTKCGRDMLLLLASLKASPRNSSGTRKITSVSSQRRSRLPPQRLFTRCRMSSVPLCDFTAEATCGKCFQQKFWKSGSGVRCKGISEVWRSRQGLENGCVTIEPQNKNS